MDPIGTMQRTDRLLKTYKRMGQAVGLYHSAIRFMNYKSLASSSSSYQQNGGASGTPAGAGGPDSYDIPQEGYRKRSGIRGPCQSGYVLQKVKGRWMCVRKHNLK
jgi:hypothetical protein